MVTKRHFVTIVVDRVRQAYCGLHGHDTLLQFAHDRMFLKCTSCGHESPGWKIAEPRSAPAATPAARRPALVRPQLVGVRRVA
jgi:hypothetical protein